MNNYIASTKSLIKLPEPIEQKQAIEANLPKLHLSVGEEMLLKRIMYARALSLEFDLGEEQGLAPYSPYLDCNLNEDEKDFLSGTCLYTAKGNGTQIIYNPDKGIFSINVFKRQEDSNLVTQDSFEMTGDKLELLASKYVDIIGDPLMRVASLYGKLHKLPTIELIDILKTLPSSTFTESIKFDPVQYGQRSSNEEKVFKDAVSFHAISKILTDRVVEISKVLTACKPEVLREHFSVQEKPSPGAGILETLKNKLFKKQISVSEQDLVKYLINLDQSVRIQLIMKLID